MCKPLLTLVLLSASSLGLTQTPPAPIPPASTPATKTTSTPIGPSPGYTDEAAVVERGDVLYRFAEDGTGTKLGTSVVRVQSSAALQSLAVLSFPYASGNQRLEIVYARVRKPDGTVVETPATDAQDQPAPVTQFAPMYSDLRLKQLPIRSLAVGDKLEFQTRITQMQPEISGEFWGQESFGAGIIFLERSIELRVPKQKQVTVSSPEHPPEISETGGERVYRWTGTQLRSPSAKHDNDVAGDNKPPVAWTTFPTWEAVGVWYRGVIVGRDAVTPAIQAKADELTAGAKTDIERVQALYYYVSSHNHYIGIDFGIGRYQPHAASEVLTNQYGDCKDKHTLLAALLRAKGFQVSAVLIGAGIEMNQKVPMPSAFNHIITLVDVGGEKVWLDATTEVAPYRALLAVLRDKEALVIPATGAPQLLKTPAQLPFPALTHYEAKSELDKSGSLKGTVEISLRGDDEMIMRIAARQIARTQWDQLSQNYSNGCGLNGTTSGTMLDTPDDLSGPWRLRYDYAQDAYSEWPNYRIGALLPNVNLPSIDEKNPPKKAIDLGSLHTLVLDSTIHLPESYSADLPDAIHLKTAFATFDRTYQFKGGDLVAQVKLETLATKIPASDWKNFKKFVDDMGTEPWIQLTGKVHIAGEKGPPLAGENNAVSADLVREVYRAIVAKNYALAREKSDQALAVNDKQAYLWSERGYLAGLRNDNTEAADDYEKELKQHPEDSDQYPGLIYAEGRLGRKEKQRAYLLEYAKAVPGKDSVTLFVGTTLLALNNVNDAIDVYRAGAKANPENKSIQIELGNALLSAGKSDEGIGVVKSALLDSSDPQVLNTGAYALIGRPDQLPLAQSNARKAVDLLETESKQIELGGVNPRSFFRTALLLATWDTLGWIYFSEGKIDLAEPYLRAAWKSDALAEVGLHWGQLLEKRGEKVQASQIYEMALTRMKGTPSNPVLDQLHTRVDGLRKQGVQQQYPHPDEVLQEQRTFHVPRPHDLKGSAIFFTLVSTKKTEKVEFVSGDEPMRGEGNALAYLDLGLAVPRDSQGLLLRSGVLFCSTHPTCDFVLTPPEHANIK